MAANNAIGKGALILTANADGLLSGLDKAANRATNFAGSLESRMKKATGGDKGGGILGRVLGFGKAVGASFLGAGLLQAMIKGPELAMQAFDALEKRATGLDKGALAGIRGSFQLLQDAGLGLLQKVVTAAAPAITRVADVVLKFVDRMAPYIDTVVAIFETVAYVGAEVFGVVVEWIGGVIDSVADWVDGMTGLGTSTEDMGAVTMRVLRVIGKGFAYVWDTVQAGAGVVAVVAGAIVEAFGTVVKVIGEAAKKLADLASILPDAIRPEWVGRIGGVVAGWGADIDGIGEKMREWGRGAIAGFGDSAPKVDQWFDRIEGRFDRVKAGIGALGDKAAAFSPKLTGAALKDTAAAYSIVAKYQAGNMLSEANKQLQEQKKGNDILTKIKNQLEKAPPLKAV